MSWAINRRHAWLRLVLVTLIAVLAASANAKQTSELLALCYHDVADSAQLAELDPMAVSVDTLISHLSWLAGNGYEPITMEQWRAAQTGGSLPEKPVLLTFDDGYASFYTHVLPLLELFEFPAVLAPVTRWIDTPADTPVAYGDEMRARSQFLTWPQIKEIAGSGLVELASHSHDLHHGTLANPQGNQLPAAAVHGYVGDESRYETDQEYRARIDGDLQTSKDLIQRNTERAPTTMVWPYGAYNRMTNQVANQVGMPVAMTLDDIPNHVGTSVIHRVLIDNETSLPALARIAETAFGLRPTIVTPLRAAHVDLDYVYDEDADQLAANLDVLLDRIKDLQINTVFLQAFADADGDGIAQSLYFPNRHLPMRADLFNRVAWQLQTRADVRVFAWMPVMAFELDSEVDNKRLAVVSNDGSHAARYHRLSPFQPEARQIISDIYDDLGRAARFSGVLFHDDAFFTDREFVDDASGGAMSVAGKSQALIDFTLELAAVLRRWQPGLLTARNLYARVIVEPDSEQWFAQSYAAFLESYDYTAVMAMPYLEQAKNPQDWLENLLKRSRRTSPQALQRTIFHLQTQDWRTSEPLSEHALAGQFDLLLRRGARNIAYYPDDFLGNHPDLSLVRSHLSVNTHPALKR